MKNIFIIRHGQSMGNVDAQMYREMGHKKVPLTEKGIKQIESATEDFLKFVDAEALIGDSFKVFFSPYTRAFQSKDVFLDKLENQLHLSDILEDAALGEQDGGSVAHGDVDLAIANKEWYDSMKKHGYYRGTPTNGESAYDVVQRLIPFVDTLLEEESDVDNIILVCHSTVLKSLTKILLNLPGDEIEKTCTNGAVRRISFKDDVAIDSGFVHGGIDMSKTPVVVKKQ